MKKLMVIALVTSSILSANECFKVIGVDKDDSLNIRAKQTWRSKKMGSIPFNATTVISHGCEGGLSMEAMMSMTPEQAAAANKKNPGWCKVEYEGSVGWVSKRYLKENDCMDAK